MSETLQSQRADNEPSLLDSEIEKAQNSVRGRIARRFGRAVVGRNHPLEVVSGKEADLRAIRDAGSHQASMEEVTSQLETARNSLRGRMTRRLGRWVTGKDHPLEIVSGKEARLASIKDDLERNRPA